MHMRDADAYRRATRDAPPTRDPRPPHVAASELCLSEPIDRSWSDDGTARKAASTADNKRKQAVADLHGEWEANGYPHRTFNAETGDLEIDSDAEAEAEKRAIAMVDGSKSAKQLALEAGARSLDHLPLSELCTCNPYSRSLGWCRCHQDHPPHCHCCLCFVLLACQPRVAVRSGCAPTTLHGVWATRRAADRR